MKKLTPAYAYLRVSGQGQLSGHGFDRQLETIEAFAKQVGYSIEGTFKEAVSGTAEEGQRPAFTEMVTSILANGVEMIIIESLDRLARQYRLQEQLLVYLVSKGIHLTAANTGEVITAAIADDPMKKAMVQIQGIFAELDKSLLVRKLRKSRERIRKKYGKCEGRPATYQETEFGREVLGLIRRLRRKPRGGQKRMTWQQIAKELNDLGYRNDRGGMFTWNAVQGIAFRNRKR